MYKEFETRTSYNYLQEVIAALHEPICILGGWAVFFHVQKNFYKVHGRPYLGSRDIDLGFHLQKHMTFEELKHSSFGRTYRTLCETLGFKQLSFRLLKHIHTETEQELSDARFIPSHFIFPMYIDLIVDTIPLDFRKTFGFTPVDEPFLSFVFQDIQDEHLVVEFHKKLLLPTPELLLAMKIHALPQRDKEHKRVKDLCDIFALLWYSDLDKESLSEKLKPYVPEAKVKEFFATLDIEDIEKVGLHLNHRAEEIQGVLDLLKMY